MVDDRTKQKATLVLGRTGRTGRRPRSASPSLSAANVAELRMLVELAYRANDGIEVVLLWNRATDAASVFVLDSRTDESFTVPAAKENALDVFYHPFAYAADGISGPAEAVARDGSGRS